jgi:hypothetical protein
VGRAQQTCFVKERRRYFKVELVQNPRLTLASSETTLQGGMLFLIRPTEAVKGKPIDKNFII